jgi:hypothetical protein
MTYAVGSLVRARERERVILPDTDDEVPVVRPLGGADDEATAGRYAALLLSSRIHDFWVRFSRLSNRPRRTRSPRPRALSAKLSRGPGHRVANNHLRLRCDVR